MSYPVWPVQGTRQRFGTDDVLSAHEIGTGGRKTGTPIAYGKRGGSERRALFDPERNSMTEKPTEPINPCANMTGPELEALAVDEDAEITERHAKERSDLREKQVAENDAHTERQSYLKALAKVAPKGK